MFQGIDNDKIKEILRQHFTPSDHITTPERLLGRDRLLERIDRAFNSSGRLVFIYGDRGVGKSSLALTAAHLHNSAQSQPIHVNCSEHGTFESVLTAIGRAAVDVVERFESPGAAPSFNLTVMGNGVGYSPGNNGAARVNAPSDINEAVDIIRYVGSKRSGTVVIVIDEFERIKSVSERMKFAELIKNFPDDGGRIHLIICGIASTVDELLGAHPSAGRRLETVEVQRLHHDQLWKIITNAADKVNVEVGRETLIRIGMISDGFPHYVHLIGESLFWAMHDDEKVVSKCKARHYKAGIAEAIGRSDAIYKAAYNTATKKTKNTADYENALWALADHNDLQRQLGDIYKSYLHIVAQLNRLEGLGGEDRKEPIARTALNSRLQRLRDPNHGEIIIGHGAGWFSFRENVIRGYVRLVAEEKGLELARDNFIPK